MQATSNINTRLANSVIKKLDAAASEYRLTRKAVFEEIINRYLDLWASEVDLHIREEIRETLEKFFLIKRQRGKTRYWVLEQVLGQHSDVNQYEIGFIGNRLDISPNYLVRRLNRLKKERGEQIYESVNA